MYRMRSCGVALFVSAMVVFTGGCASAPPISVSLSTSVSHAIDQGQTVGITATVNNDGSQKGVTWTLTGPGSLSNSTGLSVTYNSPTASLASAQQVTITATSMADQRKTASVQITVNPYPQIAFQTLASGSVGVPYNQTIAFTGGTPPFQWTLHSGPGTGVSGSVPDGLTLDASTGKISGTPTSGGTWYFEAHVTDAAGVTVNDDLSIRINSSVPPGNPVPFLNQPLVPAAVAPGGAGLVLNVSGTGFVAGARIDFNRVPLATAVVDSGHLTATVAATEIANAGTASVTVVNPAPGGGRSNPVHFQVGAPQAQVNFANAPNSPLQIRDPFGIALGDFNEDGKPDLAIAANWRIYLFLGNGDGTFAPAAGSPLSVPIPPVYNSAFPYTGPIVAGDFDNSGHLGLAVVEDQNTASVILLGNGDGTFVPSSATFVETLRMGLSGLAPADFNADGNLDLATINQIYGQSPVFLGYGKGAFNSAGTLYTRGFAHGLAVGDFNADGKLDAVVAGGGSSTYPDSGVAVSLGNGDGTFTLASGSPVPLGQSLSAVVASDYNGDGKLDVAVTDSAANTVMILLGNGDGTFGPATTIPLGNEPKAIVADDFNNDGKLDLAVANYGDDTISLLLGNGDGTFTQPSGSPYAVGHNPVAIVAADFNGDGKLDLAVANLMDWTVSILLQQ